MSLKSNNCEEVQESLDCQINWHGLSKNIKFICNTFIWVLSNNLIAEIYRAIEKKSNLVAIPWVDIAIFV